MVFCFSVKYIASRPPSANQISNYSANLIHLNSHFSWFTFSFLQNAVMNFHIQLSRIVLPLPAKQSSRNNGSFQKRQNRLSPGCNDKTYNHAPLFFAYPPQP